jgi:uncharacterized protein YutE (UPF0331/DUF86 family)
MSPLDRDIVRRKLGVIIENLKALEQICSMSEAEYLSDIYRRKATERLLQELIEAAIDINVHIITRTGQQIPDDYFESFIRLGESGIISSDLARALAPSSGLRNRLVHEYDALDHSIILRSVKMARNLYPKYIKEVEEYLQKVPV